MTADHLSYKRATTVCLIGLSIQAFLAIALLIYARLGQDTAAMTGALMTLLFLLIWVALAVVFHQHGRERLEAMENESFLRSDAASASVFEGAVADNQAQALRLAWIHKWFLPAMSLVIAGSLIGIGFLRFGDARAVLRSDTSFDAPGETGWAISIGLGLAAVGFIFGRYVSGMAKQKVWIMLNAGAAAAVGSALVGLALAVGHLMVVVAKNEWLLRYLPAAFGAAMIALGAEMALNFVLNLYRPRKVGEYPRPAFDSRVLAFLAAPDRLAESISEAINYQFGFNVSSTWFYQLLARSVLSLVVLGLAVLWLMSIFTVIRPHERGLLIRNGALIREVGPGLVIDWPWPFSRVERFTSAAVSQISAGTSTPDLEGPILWTNEHTTREKYLLVQAGVAGAREGDLNLIAVEVPIHYVVNDLRKYTALAQDGPEGKRDSMRISLLTSVAEGVVMRHLAMMTVDGVLGAARLEMTAALRREIQDAFDTRLDAGVTVIFVGVAGAHPNKEVAPAFEQVVAADQKMLATEERARADALRTLAGVVGDVERARIIVSELEVLRRLRSGESAEAQVIEQEQKINQMIAEAGGEAAVIIAEARADRWKKHLRARARAAASEGLNASYMAAPLPFRVARYIDAFLDSAVNARVWIIPPDSIRITLDDKQLEPTVTGFAPDAEPTQ